MIVIVDFGVGNIAALINMYDHLGIECTSSDRPETVASAEKLILPGVGSFDSAIRNLHSRGLVAALDQAVIGRRVPILGVCLGMQLFARKSEEGVLPGLGWIDAEVVRLVAPSDGSIKVPHIGWSEVHAESPSTLFPDVASMERFYFVHSYYMKCSHARDVTAVVSFGGDVCCAVSVGNVYGVQFHPEKSHRFGMRLLRSFALEA